MLNEFTPTENYTDYWVKREDLACSWPGPPFAKVRGLYRGLQDIHARGIREVGYYETSVSMATWGVSYFSHLLNIKPVIFYYQYKEGNKNNQEKQQIIWNKFGADIIINEKPNMQKLHEAVSRNEFNLRYPNGEFLPAGLKFDYTVEEVAKQVHLVLPEALGGTVVICCGSGMMTAGVISGLSELGISQDVIGVIVHPKSKSNLKNFVIKKSHYNPFHKINFSIVDYGYEYTQQENCFVPFPCCKYYDRKAYKWMIDNLDKLKKPVLFWNIGSSYTYYSKGDLQK